MKKIEAGFRDKKLFVGLFGKDVYAVGGYVRDRLRGISSDDIDILVTRRPLEDIVTKIEPYGKVDLVGKSFGIIKFTIKGKTYDLALPRTDRPKGDASRGHKNILASSDPDLPLETDLERRDFRCNSIALRLADGKLIDPFDGAKDIRAQIIRVTNPKSFPEDPLRVLRAARLASILGFSMDPAIYDLAKSIDLSGLSVERVNEELFKILLFSDRPSLGLEELFKLGALRQLFPELYALTLIIQDSVFHPEKDDFGHHTVWHHTKLTVDQARRLAGSSKWEAAKILALLLAALFHDVGKAETTQWEFKRGRMVITSAGHDGASERIARKIFSRLRIFSWNGFPLRKTALLLIKTHHRASELWQNRKSVTRKAFNRLASDTAGEIELVAYLDVADRKGRKDRPVQGLDREGKWLLGKFRELRVDRETIKPLIMGRDLIKLGVAPGPEMGKMLDELYKRQMDNEFETKARGLKLAEKLVAGAP
ncbi:MAG: HD domain-containing protein [Candidatus Aminicenantales bacterium]